MVNHYYVYILDRDFGPLFIKFCSYFPYPAKLCLNGHEWLKRQLTQRGIPVRAVGQRHPLERRRRPRPADRRHARRRQDRRGLSQMAPTIAASLCARAPRGRLSLSPLDPAERVRPDPGPRSAAHRPLFLRRGHPRESRPRPSRSDATDLRSPRHPPHARALPHPRVDRGRRARRSTCSTKSPRSSSTTKKARPFAPKPPSTTPTTSTSVVRSAICPPCGRSALPPTDASCTSNL